MSSSRPVAIPTAPCPNAERLLPGHQFADACKVPAPHGIDAIEATRLAFARGPWWVRLLMGLRNGLGRLVGLKPARSRGFTILSETPREVVMGFDDRHLDFRIVVTVAGGFATVSTLVRSHNAWGRAYLAAVLPFHRVIAARMIESVA